MKKIASFILVCVTLCNIFILSGCEQSVEEVPIQVAVFNTKYNGYKEHKYPDYIFTSNKILNIIENSTGQEEFNVEKVEVLYNLEYYNENNEKITVIVQNTGKCTFMKFGLPMIYYYFTEGELSDFVEYIEGTKVQ